MRELMNYLAMAFTVVASVGGLVYGVGRSVASFDVAAAQATFESTRPAVREAIEQMSQMAAEPTATCNETADATDAAAHGDPMGYTVIARHDPFAMYATTPNPVNAESQRTVNRAPSTMNKSNLKRSVARNSSRSAHPQSFSRGARQSASAHGAGSAGSYYRSAFRTQTAPYFRKPTMPRGMSPGGQRNTR